MFSFDEKVKIKRSKILYIIETCARKAGLESGDIKKLQKVAKTTKLLARGSFVTRYQGKTVGCPLYQAGIATGKEASMSDPLNNFWTSYDKATKEAIETPGSIILEIVH